MTEDIKIDIDRLNKRSWSLYEINSNKGYNLAKKAEALSLYHDYRKGYGYSLYNKASNLYSSYSIEESLYNFIKSSTVFNEVSDIDGLLKSYVGISDSYFMLGSFNKCLETNLELLKLASEYNYHKVYLKSLIRCMLIFIEQGKYQKALEKGNEALKLYSKVAYYELEPVIYKAMGDIYIHIGKYNLAIEMLKKALKIYTDNENRFGEALCICSLGDYFSRLTETHIAEKSFMLSIYKSKGCFNRELILYNCAKFFKSIGKDDIVKNLFDEACALLIEKNSIWQLRKLLGLLSSEEHESEVFQKANDLCEKYQKYEGATKILA